MKTPFERSCVISGIGQSQVGRNLGRSEMALTVQAALAAIDDAGLRRDEIDGLSTYPGWQSGTAHGGFGGPGASAVVDALGLQTAWYAASNEGSAQLSAVVHACLAVASGLARHVLVYRTVTESTAQRGGGRSGPGTVDRLPREGQFQWDLPFGAVSALTSCAMLAQRHRERFGLTRQQLGQVALTARANAARNPNAVKRDPLTMQDYLDARMVSTPLGLYDCDIPCDGSTAFVISSVETAADRRHVPVQVQAVGTGTRGRPSWDQYENLDSFAGRDPATRMWQRTDLRPADVDIAQLYDGFTILTVLWLEALGFCGTGEAGAFLDGGARIAMDGQLPLNTAGGQLSGGRLHGLGLLHEAVLQLRHQAGERQVAGGPEVAVVANGGGFTTGCLLVTRGTSPS